MIWKVIEIHLRRLRHNRVEWLLTFVVPIAFFSVFAWIFTHGVGTTPKVKVALVNASHKTDRADASRTGTESAIDEVTPSEAFERCQYILDQLGESEGLRVMLPSDNVNELNREAAETMVRRGIATIAVVVNADGDQLSAELLNDSSDKVASQVVTALVTQAMMANSTPTVLPTDEKVASQPHDSKSGPGHGPSMRNVAATSKPASQPNPLAAQRPVALPAFAPPKIEVVNILGEGKSNPVISVYAAGIAVMFLLFNASTGGGVLLEERENQTLERLLSTQMTMDQLLLGKWFYLTLLGCVQVTVMFMWAQLVFGLDFVAHLDGFAIMTLATSAAAASFGLFLATLCRTRGQLGGLSVIAILTMSALGGSMVPRYVMSDSLQRAGLWTFNAWALDGYDKVFWRELPVGELGPQLTVLLAAAFGLLVAARVLAIRWETA